MANTVAPLYQLLKKLEQWNWGPPWKQAFEEAKSQLTYTKILTHFDPSKKFVLSWDASPLGAVCLIGFQMAQRDQSHMPLALWQLQKKIMLKLRRKDWPSCFGVKKFLSYLLGRRFTVYSDCKPLQYLFSESRPVPIMASARTQRLALTLSAYNYSIEFRSGRAQGNADGLSRLPLKETPEVVPQPGGIVLRMERLSYCNSPVNVASIRTWTARDPILSRV